MGIKWKDFELPKRVICNEDSYSDTYGEFIAEPFERGYGTTVGNSLRRVLLSSIEGAAVTKIKVDGAVHEFSTLPGVKEDLSKIILNIKQLIFKLHSNSPKEIYLEVNKKGEITGEDLELDERVELINFSQHLFTLTKKNKIRMKMVVGKGRGYLPAEMNSQEEEEVGVIPVDSIFAPVKKVNYKVENTRVHQVTEYDKLTLEIWTDGSITPKHALLYASNILQRHLDVFVGFGRLPEEEEEEDEELKELKQKLSMPINELELSVRSSNCLNQAGIEKIGELVQKTDKEMLDYKNFGKKSLAEIKRILDDMDLSLGMEVDESWLGKKEE